ncbi:hypothetical protein [Spirilliplanes yamanashiensis]|uniref:Uncharacterized protein n=1 Tax=Spirilliplanes yamanashiensis TaxID=42233 RepID=A0A8J3YDI0_9ACTN|nr:hypothetical protein [Spirilliplanes yamanashiensis]MDP9816214.1 hypothetical protein [Spirilliplanes yamanashiensis]GIJ05740.1 hypothetical protein Sya03_50920 [Spirilliplanes yamanashiensis]
MPADVPWPAGPEPQPTHPDSPQSGTTPDGPQPWTTSDSPQPWTAPHHNGPRPWAAAHPWAATEAWEPPPGPPPVPPRGEPWAAGPPAGARRRLPLVPLVGGLAVLLVAGGASAAWALRADPPPPPPAAESTAEATTSPPAPPTTAPAPDDPPDPPGRVGVVAIAAVVTDGRAAVVAAVFDTHFAGINARDWEGAAAVFDPAGSVDPGNPQEVARWRRDLSTTTDTKIVLREVGDAVDGHAGPVVTARVTFRSEQSPGYGPRARPRERCTFWDVTYLLTPSPDGSYRILRGSGTSRPGW